MATRMLRRGLPRVAGGEPWPPAGNVEVADASAPAVASGSVQEVSAAESQVSVAEPAGAHAALSVAESEVSVAEPGPRAPEAPVGASATAGEVGVEVTDTSVPNPSTASGIGQGGSEIGSSGSGSANLRRGLPRTPGGEPWPPAGAVANAGPVSSAEPVVSAADTSTGSVVEVSDTPDEDSPSPSTGSGIGPTGSAVASVVAVGGDTLRRGLPRTPGGEPWPPAGTAAVAAAPVVAEVSAPSEGSGSEGSSGVVAAAPSPSTGSGIGEEAPAALAMIDVSTPLPFQRTVFPGKNAFNRPAPKPEPARVGPFTKGQWAGAVVIGGAGLLVAAAMAVVFVRWLLSAGPLHDFVQTYPGEYHLPEGAPVGFPGWLGWQHFFNFFLMVLIIRSGLRIRNEKRPTAFWTPRNDPTGKVSLTIWFHQALDVLWLVNGIVFVVLLFMTGQWMRVIPTSWEVFPNAISAVLQYISLDWPTENGWVNYNSIQQITYFTTIFIAAPLAAVTGFRMSGMWPKKAEKLSKAYPIEWARMLHFPVMLYFVVFIAIHVFLVLATGALRNLNHMYAAQGSVDPSAYAENWTGFWFFAASLVVIAAAWVAARPLVLAPIAKLFGSVSAR